MREAEDLIWREQLFVHLRICTFVWPMLPIKPPKNNKYTEDTIQWEPFLSGSFVNLCIRVWAKEITALMMKT